MVKNILVMLRHVLVCMVKGPAIILGLGVLAVAILYVGLQILWLSYQVARFGLDLAGVGENYGAPIAIVFSLMVGYSYILAVRALQMPSVDYHSLRGRKLEES